MTQPRFLHIYIYTGCFVTFVHLKIMKKSPASFNSAFRLCSRYDQFKIARCVHTVTDNSCHSAKRNSPRKRIALLERDSKSRMLLSLLDIENNPSKRIVRFKWRNCYNSMEHTNRLIFIRGDYFVGARYSLTREFHTERRGTGLMIKTTFN